MRIIMGGVVAAAAVALAVATAANVGASGLARLHAQVKIGHKVCMADHDHYGESGLWPTKGHAMAAAQRSWSGFTGLEYGRAWASYSLAEGRKMTCAPSKTIRGEMWGCKVSARPCRLDH
jgi:hypothetical protein